MERLSETERRGSLASSAAAELKAEVKKLRAQLAASKAAAAAAAAASTGDVEDSSSRERWAEDRVALEKRLRRAEAKKALVEMQAENEVSVLWAEVKRLKGILGEKESSLERIKWNSNMSLLAKIDGDATKDMTTPPEVIELEREIGHLRTEISKLCGEAEKDRTAGEATATLRATCRVGGGASRV